MPKLSDELSEEGGSPIGNARIMARYTYVVSFSLFFVWLKPAGNREPLTAHHRYRYRRRIMGWCGERQRWRNLRCLDREVQHVPPKL